MQDISKYIIIFILGAIIAASAFLVITGRSSDNGTHNDAIEEQRRTIEINKNIRRENIKAINYNEKSQELLDGVGIELESAEDNINSTREELERTIEFNRESREIIEELKKRAKEKNFH